jgi:hypothetical protein
MHFTSTTLLSLLILTSASALTPRAAAVGLTPICPGLKTVDKACIRYTSGFDVTGVVTEVALAFPLIKTACDCIQQCLDRPTSCATYVYKFTSPAAVASGHRTCTLYSQFNLPSAVTIDVNLTASVDVNAAEVCASFYLFSFLFFLVHKLFRER